MSENPLTFSELRKAQKQEKRQEDLSDLADNFILRVSNYLEMKKDVDNREYRSAKRVFDKIIGLRQEKIVKQAKFAVKSENGGSSELNLLPREKELFLELKNIFQDFDQNIEKMIEGEESLETPDIDLEEETDNEPEKEPEKKGKEAEEGYQVVKIISDVPEFMGTDLESYGPFEEGEEVEIPEDNAEILVNRGNAEEIE
jgi:DNA replication initiation complex subunit (GINS family)